MVARIGRRWLGVILVAAVAASGCGMRSQEDERGKNHMKVRSGSKAPPPGSVTGSPQPEPPAQPGDLCIVVSPGVELDFGAATVGEVATRTVSLTNTCGYAMMISSVTVTGAFGVGAKLAAPLALATGEQHRFDLVFEPSEEGEVEGALVIEMSSTSLEGSVSKISLRGKGIPR